MAKNLSFVILVSPQPSWTNRIMSHRKIKIFDFNVYNIYSVFFNANPVLKTTENLGVSYVKLTEQYKKKLDAESKMLNFPYRPEVVSLFSLTAVLHVQVHLKELNMFP